MSRLARLYEAMRRRERWSGVNKRLRDLNVFNCSVYGRCLNMTSSFIPSGGFLGRAGVKNGEMFMSFSVLCAA